MRNASPCWHAALAAALLVLGLDGSSALAQSSPFGRDYLIGELTPITDLDGPPKPPPSVDLDIPFEYDSTRLTAAARAQLTELGYAITAPVLEESRFGVYGHTDAAGSDAYNLALSVRRAEAVRTFLVEAFPIAPDRLEVAGFGESRLKYPDAPRDARNRRVEIVNLTPLARPPAPEASEAEVQAEPDHAQSRPDRFDPGAGARGGSDTGFGGEPMGQGGGTLSDFGGGFEAAPEPETGGSGGVPFY